MKKRAAAAVLAMLISLWAAVPVLAGGEPSEEMRAEPGAWELPREETGGAAEEEETVPAGAEEPAADGAASDSGSCGGSVSWRLAEGVLTVSGSGAMEDASWTRYTSEIRQVVISDGVTTVCESAFEGCTALESVTLGSSVRLIDEFAFSGCTALKSLTAAESLTRIAGWAFRGCTALETLVLDGVEAIGFSSFEGCESLREARLGDSLTAISDNAFRSCASLETITLPITLEDVGDRAFAGCTALMTAAYDGDKDAWYEISIGEENDALFRAAGYAKPEAVGRCGNDLVWSLTTDGVFTVSGEGVMTDDVASIHAVADKILAVVVNDGAENIGARVFAGCVNLTRVTLPVSVTKIGDQAFQGCGSLRSIELPDRLTSIGAGAFLGSGLETVVFPEKLRSIGDLAFQDCRALTEAVIPASVTTLGDGVFSGCTALRSAELPAGLARIPDSLFGGCGSLRRVTIPGNVTVIGERAFFQCDGLTAVDLPDSLTEIEYAAFAGSDGLTSVAIPARVTAIGEAAFGDTGVSDVYYPGTRSAWDAMAQGPGDPFDSVTVHLEGSGAERLRLSGGSAALDGVAVRLLALAESGALADYLPGVHAGDLLKAAEEGSRIHGRLMVREAASLTDGEETLAAEAANGAPPLLRLELALLLTRDGETVGAVSRTDGPLELTLTLTEAELAALGGRTLKVVAVSGGEAVPLDVERRGGSVVFSTDRFGAVVIVPGDEAAPGDVNGDGAVDRKDRIYLARHLAGWAGYEIADAATADVNGDGAVDRKDRICLARYLAGWENYAPVRRGG